jgi:hypothetical protein
MMLGSFPLTQSAAIALSFVGLCSLTAGAPEEKLIVRPTADITIPTSIGTHMKPTIEISDALFVSVKRQTAKEGSTVRSLVERGLTLVLKSTPAKPFR